MKTESVSDFKARIAGIMSAQYESKKATAKAGLVKRNEATAEFLRNACVRTPADRGYFPPQPKMSDVGH